MLTHFSCNTDGCRCSLKGVYQPENSQTPNAESRGGNKPSGAHGPASDRLRPWLLGGAVALCVARPLWPSESAAAYGDGLPAVMLWLALGVLWMLGAIGRPQLHIRADWTDATVLLLLAWHTLAAVVATTRGAPRPAVNMLWEWVGFVLCFLAVRQFLSGRRETRAVLAVMVAIAVGLAGYGLYKKYYEMPQTRAYYYAHRDELFPADAPERKLLEDRLSEPYPRATFALSNSLAGFLVPWAVIYAAIIFSPHLRRSQKAVAALPAMVLLACLLLTRSRSALIATALGAVAAALVQRRSAKRNQSPRSGLLRRWQWLSGGVVVVLVLSAGSLLGSDVPRQGIAGAVKSFRYRLDYWRASAAMIADHLWLGCGPGNFQDYYTRYKLPHAPEEVTDPHNFLLELSATAGIPAGMALLAVLVCFGTRVAPMFRSAYAGPQARRPDGEQYVGKQPAGQQSVVEPPAGAMPHIIGGMLVGYGLALPLGAMSVSPPGVMPVVIGLPLAVVTLLALRPWINSAAAVQGGGIVGNTHNAGKGGEEPQRAVWPKEADAWLDEARLATIAVATMLINLLAAGGIGYPGLAVMFWLLLGLGLNAAGARQMFTAGRTVAVAGLLLLLGGMFACYLTAYSPVLRSRALMELAMREAAAGRTEAAQKAVEAAAAADPLSADAPRLAAELALKRWLQQGNPAALMAAQYYTSHMVRLVPQSAAAWGAAGDLYDRIAEALESSDSPPSDFRQEALRAYQQAVHCYPNSPMYQAKVALALRAVGEHQQAREAAERALALDAAQEMGEKKLPPAMRSKLEALR